MLNYQGIARQKPNNYVSEQYRKLRTNIDFSNINEKLKVLNFTSTLPGEGKTITVINLSIVYAQAKIKTLIIDMDLRKPKIHKAFNIVNKNGLSEYVISDLNMKENIVKINDYLDVIVAGEEVPFPSEVLLSKKVKSLLEELKLDYDRIIIDCPPMAAVADATIISNLCDGTIFIVASRNTNGSMAKDCVKELESSGAKIIGGVLTKVQKRDQYNEKGYNYYYCGEY